MTASVPASLEAALSRLSLDDHEEVLKAVNAALKKSKSDVTAQHWRALALLQLDRYEDAVRAFEEGGTALKEQAWFEYGYALYRSGRPEQAVQIASEHRGGRGITHLLAQAVCSILRGI
jgi:signal recognition particle subunit SRP72